MNRIALIAGTALIVALAACSQPKTTAPGAVGTSSCCKENKGASCDATKAAACKDKAACADKAAAAPAPGAVGGAKKDGCGTACPMGGAAKPAGCPMTGTPNS